MNNKKPVYLLAGGRGSGNTDPIIRAIFRDIGKASPTIAYMGAASEDRKDFFERVGAMIKRVGECRIIHVLTYAKNTDLNKANDILRSADAVFVGGGDVELAMQALVEKSITSILLDIHERGKLFFGISAGSIMLAKEWVRWKDPNDDSTAELFPCLGLAPVICDTHGEADNWEELKTALRLKQEGAFGYGITSGTCLKVFPDGKVEALGSAIYQYVRHGEAVQRQPDILPYNS